MHFHPPGSPRAGRPPVLVKEGFSWPCLILGWVGLLWSGAWITTLLAGAISFVLAALLRHVEGGWPILVGWHVLLGLFAHDLHRLELSGRGLLPGPLVGGRDADSAMLRLLDRQPGLIGDQA